MNFNNFYIAKKRIYKYEIKQKEGEYYNLNYVKIPREIIYDKNLSSKRVIVFSYLCARRSLDDTVAFSTTELCHWSKLKPNYRDGKINQKYYEVLLLLSHYGYFTEYPDFEKSLKENTNSVKYQQVKLNIEKFDIPDKFGIIYFDELNKILNYKEELKNSDMELARMSSAYILLLLSYIRVNINRLKGKPLCCYRYFKTISEDIGLSEKYVKRIVNILEKLKIIKCQPMKRESYIKDGCKKFLTTPKVFADYRHFIYDEHGQRIDDKYDAVLEINEQIKLLENN